MSRIVRAAMTSQRLSLTAMEEASRQGLRQADLEHLLLALSLSEEGAGQVLRGLGVTLDRVRDALAEHHAALVSSLGITSGPPEPGPIVFHETGGYEWSRRALDVLARASRRGRKGDAAAVLRALLAEPSGVVSDVLRRLGTTAAEVRTGLDEVEGVPPRRRPTADAADALSGATEAFIPAPPEQVWSLIADPARLPEWDPAIGSVDAVAATEPPRPGDTWSAHAPTRRPDGRSIRVKRDVARLEIELVERVGEERVVWRTRYPDSLRGNTRRVAATLSPTGGGTRLEMTFSWERHPERRRRALLALLMRPLARFAVWITLFQLSGGISRAFR